MLSILLYTVANDVGRAHPREKNKIKHIYYMMKERERENEQKRVIYHKAHNETIHFLFSFDCMSQAYGPN